MNRRKIAIKLNVIAYEADAIEIITRDQDSSLAQWLAVSVVAIKQAVADIRKELDNDRGV